MSDLADTVADEVSEQVDPGGVVKGDGVVEQLDGAQFGKAVGEAVGSYFGRKFGDLVFGRLLSKLGLDDDDETSRTGRVLRGVGVATARTLASPAVKEPVGEALRDLVERRESEDADGSSDGTADADDESGGDSAAKIDTETLQSLKRDTYRDLLERMDYSELQSLAKDAGVKANQKREQLVEELVEQFGDESSEEDADDADDEN